MRPTTIIGLILLVAGIATFYFGGSFTTQREVLKVGEVRLSARERHVISPWIATAAILAGTVLLLTSAGAEKSRVHL